MKIIVLFALFLNVADGRKNISKLQKQDARDMMYLNTHDDEENNDISIYTSDFFDKADSFKTLSQQKEDELKLKSQEEAKKMEDQQKAKNQIQSEIDLLKKQIIDKQNTNTNIISKKPVPIEEIEIKVDANELNQYSLQLRVKAENSEPEEPVLYHNSEPKKVSEELPVLDILDIDISGTDLKSLQQQHKYFIEENNFLQINEEESSLANVEIDGGENDADSEKSLGQSEQVQTDLEASNLVIEQADAVQEISDKAMSDIENDEAPEEEAKSSPELNQFIETASTEGAEEAAPAGAEEDAPATAEAAATSSQTQEQQDNIKAFGEKMGIELPSSLFELSDNASISAGLVEAAVNAGKSEDEIGAALAA